MAANANERADLVRAEVWGRRVGECSSSTAAPIFIIWDPFSYSSRVFRALFAIPYCSLRVRGDAGVSPGEVLPGRQPSRKL